jgi:uncharacterized protein (TIGR02118 family)
MEARMTMIKALVILLRLPGLRYYAQQHVRGAFFGGESPCDGIAEMWFDDVEALRVAFASPAGSELQADNPSFVDDARTRLVVADEIVLRPLELE